MKIILIAFILLAFCPASSAQAQTLDPALLDRYEAATLRALYPVCRSTTLTVPQQIALADAFSAEEARFAELLMASKGILSPDSEAELDAQRDAAIRRILDPQQLVQYYRAEVYAEARKRGKEVQRIVGEQVKLSYMELKYIYNTFTKIEQEVMVSRLLHKGLPAKIKADEERIRREGLAQLEAKSGIAVDGDLRAVRRLTLNDYAPLMVLPAAQ